MIHQIVGASCLAPFRPGNDYRAALDESAGLGFNLVRVFCGPLPWAGQTLDSVYAGLPSFLGACAERGLNAYLSYCTEAGTGYDLDEHVKNVEALTQPFRVVVLREVANEPWHPTQGARLTVDRCEELAHQMLGPLCYGAPTTDEATDYDGGDFQGPHLDRSRDRWNMVRRVREMLEKRRALNQEPIGAAEADDPGKRLADPAIYLCMGALNRLFLGGSGVFHSEDGLWARPLGPVQKRCADAFVHGSRLWPGAHRLGYKNTGHDGSPAKSADFSKIVRLYFGMQSDTEAFMVAVGLAGATLSDAQVAWNDGWRVDSIMSQAIGADGRSCLVGRVVRA